MYIHVHEFKSLYVYCTYTDVNLCFDTVQAQAVQLHTHTSFHHQPGIRPDQPCNASESQLRAGPGTAPSEQLPSWQAGTSLFN